MSVEKYVYLSYGDTDKETALQLHEVLEAVFDDQVWLRHLDLRAGDLIANALADAISETKWFILMLSTNSLNSNWIKRDARLTTIRWLEDMNFNIVVIKLDDCRLPRNLRVALESQYLIDLSQVEDKQDEFLRLAMYIEEKNVARSEREVFVDRGEVIDRFAYSAKYHPIIFFLGMAGIGKTSFVLNKVGQQLRKQPLVANFRRGKGSSIDYLMRQILRKAFVRQPMDAEQLSEMELISLTAEAIKKRERRNFLFIDNLEHALGADNELSSSLVQFLEKVLAAEVRTNIVLASTRIPTYPVKIAPSCDLIRLGTLNDLYIYQCFDEWLSEHPKYDDYTRSPYMKDLVRVADGYPLAAQMLATSLKAEIPPLRILQSSEIKRLRLSLAAHILNSLVRGELSELETLVLQVIALINEPVPFDDLIAFRELKQYSNQEIQEVIYRLSNLLLLSETEEGMFSLHSFIASRFRDQLRGEKGRKLRIRLIDEIGSYSYEKALNLHQELRRVADDRTAFDDEIVTELTGEIFRYAITASKFLRMAGKDELVAHLPIDIKGSVREMVLYFYQQERDYEKALSYADKWLKLASKDYEIKLYKARCHRNLGGREDLAKAEQTLAEIEAVTYSRFFKNRIINERGKIAIQRGDEDSAKLIFEQAVDDGTTYPDTFINLARIYLRDARALPEGSSQRQTFATKAVHLLEKGSRISRSGSVAIDVYYLDLYIDALVEVEDKEAYPLLEQALKEMPDDKRLNYRMAEICRKRGDFEDAILYARRAIECGSIAAHYTLAQIYYTQALTLKEIGKQVEANKQLNATLTQAIAYRNKSPYSKHPVAATMLTKAYRERGDWKLAREAIMGFTGTKDRFVICEQCKILLHYAELSAQEGKYDDAMKKVNEARSLLNKIRSSVDPQYYELVTEAAAMYDEYIQHVGES